MIILAALGLRQLIPFRELKNLKSSLMKLHSPELQNQQLFLSRVLLRLHQKLTKNRPHTLSSPPNPYPQSFPLSPRQSKTIKLSQSPLCPKDLNKAWFSPPKNSFLSQS